MSRPGHVPNEQRLMWGARAFAASGGQQTSKNSGCQGGRVWRKRSNEGPRGPERENCQLSLTRDTKVFKMVQNLILRKMAGLLSS